MDKTTKKTRLIGGGAALLLIVVVGTFAAGAPGLGVFCFFVGGGVIAWAIWGRRRLGDRPDRLSTIYGNAHFCDHEEVQKLGLIRPDGLPLGAITVKAEPAAGVPAEGTLAPSMDMAADTTERIGYAGDRHIITVAPSRTGKGTTAIIPTLLEHDASALVIDPKGQNAAVTARRRRELGHKVVLLNPFKLHVEHFAAQGFPATHKFNPLAGLDASSENFVADVSSLCEALIVSAERDPHWGDSARDLISALVMYLVVMQTPEERATLGQLRELLTQPILRAKSDEERESDRADNPREPPEGTLLHTLMQVSTCGYPPAEQRAGRFIGAVGREFQSILSTALTQTAFLDDPAIAACLDGDDVRFLDLKRQKITVFLILPSRYMAAYARWLRLMVVSALDALTSTADRPEKPVLLLLDEFAQLGHLTSVENAMALAAGFGVQIWPIVQDVNQLRNVYKDRWETFLANAGIIQVFRPNDMTTAEYFSGRAGTWTDYVKGISEQEISRKQAKGGFTGISRSYTPQKRSLIPALELVGLSEGRAILFVAGSEFPIDAKRTPYFAAAGYKGFYDADPYHAPPSPPPPVAEPAAAPLAA